MLILTRKKSEGLRIGNGLVYVLQVKGRVRLGFRFPKDIRIVRGELLSAEEPEPRVAPDGAETHGGLLVLSREVDESIFIGDDVELKLVERRGNRVRLGIEAPQEVGVSRDVPPMKAA